VTDEACTEAVTTPAQVAAAITLSVGTSRTLTRRKFIVKVDDKDAVAEEDDDNRKGEGGIRHVGR
jgi:hypothetical protein